MIIHEVKVQPVTPIAISVEAIGHPQAISGGVFRYDAKDQDSELVGSFTTQKPDVPLGTPDQNAKRAILVAGEVLHMDDRTPTPYNTRVRVLQGATVLYEATPDVGGSGTVQDTDCSFAHLMRIVL